MTNEMNEWLRGAGPAVGNHLWQTTAFAAVVWVAALTLRKNQARVRYGLWMAASVKFLVPFALLIGLGGMLPKPQRVVAAPAVYSTVDEMTQPFSEVDYAPVAAPVESWKERVEEQLPMLAAAVWLCGVVVVLVVWAVRCRQVSLALGRAVGVESGREFELLRRVERTMGMPTRVALRMSRESMEPGVFGLGIGLSAPVLMWPERLSERLDDEHIEAILIHELTHVRKRDNLTAVLHMLVEVAFWFHPVVWWMERRMVEERERACDEAVVAMGSRPEMYAEGLLKAVRFCVESPLTCVAGITGADLNRRVRSIMTLRLKKLGICGKVMLALATIVVIAGPIVLGQAKAAQRMMLAAVKVAPMPFRAAARAMLGVEPVPSGAAPEIVDSQTATADAAGGPAFEVASIRPAGEDDGSGMGFDLTPSGRLRITRETVKGMITFAYLPNIGGGIVEGGPDWARSEEFDINAKVDDTEVATWGPLSDKERMDRIRPMLRRLLAERFKLKLHQETQVRPVFALVQAKGGAKLTEVAAPPPHSDPQAAEKWRRDPSTAMPGSFMMSGDKWLGNAIPVTMLMLEIQANARADRMVVDQTGLRGYYSFSFTPSHDKDAPILLDQIQEQLGLELQPRKLPVKIIAIDSVGQPSVDGAEVQDTPAAGAASSDPAGKLLRFEVATIKPVDPNKHGSMAVKVYPGGRLVIQNQSLASMIFIAFPSGWGGISGEQDWMNKLYYDVEAVPSEVWRSKMTDSETSLFDIKDLRLRQMLQALLIDRFHLKFHMETKTDKVYLLERSDKPLQLSSCRLLLRMRRPAMILRSLRISPRLEAGDGS